MVISENQDLNSVLEETLQEKVHLKGTSETPEVILNEKEGFIKFSGRSLPEDSKSYYKNIKDWITHYAESPLQGTHVVFVFEYFNTASSKMILEILDIIKQIEAQDNKLIIDWHYMKDDEDMLEAGEDFAEIAELKFNFVSYE